MESDSGQRNAILDIAGDIARNPGDSAAVVLLARALADWVEEARSASDLKLRMKALSRHRGNIMETPEAETVKDDPSRFLSGARRYYYFSIANDAREWVLEVPGALGADGEELDVQD